MKVKIIPGTVREHRYAITCEVMFVLEGDVIKAPLHGTLTTSFGDATSANIYRVLLENETLKSGKEGGD